MTPPVFLRGVEMRRRQVFALKTMEIAPVVLPDAATEPAAVDDRSQPPVSPPPKKRGRPKGSKNKVRN